MKKCIRIIIGLSLWIGNGCGVLALVLRLFLLICASSGVRRGRACGFGYVGGGDVVFSGRRTCGFGHVGGGDMVFSGRRVPMMHDGVRF